MNLLSFFYRKGFRLSVYSVIIPVLLQVLYVRYISYNVDESIFGSFILYISFIALVTSVLFSVPFAALTRYINETSNKSRFVNEFMTLQIPLNIIGVLIIYLYSIYKNIGFDIFLILSIYFILINRYSLNKIVIFQLIKRKQFFNISIFEKLARFFFPVLIFYFFQSSVGLLYGLLLGYLILVIYSSFQARTFKQKVLFSYKKVKIYFLYGYPLMIVNLAVWVVSLSDRYFIENYIGSAEVGLYSILAQVAGFFSILASIFTVYVQPLVFKEFSIDKKKAMEMYLGYLRKSVFIVIPAYIIFLFIPREVFAIIVNPEIILADEYYYLFHILVIASILAAYVSLLTNIFWLNNKGYILAIFWTFALLFSLIGNTFIEIYGIYAVALTKALAYLFLLVIMYFWVKNLMLKKYLKRD
jgi:O-antigen/teichoic acid export membrane protein